MLIDYWRFARSNPRFLGFGFFMAFMSSAGQTYFIGVFGQGIQADFGLDADPNLPLGVVPNRAPRRRKRPGQPRRRSG